VHNDSTPLSGFEAAGLAPQLLRAISALGFDQPTAIQAQTLAPLLAGQDILGQAQTGTGKTAAFALPLLQYLDTTHRRPQVLVLTPTRELAIQVAEAIDSFATYMNGVTVLPIYGGADIRGQQRVLRRGAQIVVGTPGRVMDHMRRGSLVLDTLTSIVLDEADEMLQMGFQEDVEWILERAPEKRQMALFSATLPPAIRTIAKKFMHDPHEVTIATRTTTAATIHQRYWRVAGLHKLDALARILEAEETDGVIVFVRTRAATVELAQKLEERGFNAVPLNGDIPQRQRELTVDRLRDRKIHILVATDVAARGLDVERISHVINYDMPHDAEAYIHRVGRTGRAGRRGEAILFVSSRERSMLRVIEKATRQPIEELDLPTPARINEQRLENFKKTLASQVKEEKAPLFRKLVEEVCQEQGIDPLDLAAAAARLYQGDQPLLLPEKPVVTKPQRFEPSRRETGYQPKPGKSSKKRDRDSFKRESFRVEVGHVHGVKPGNLMGAIANEAGLDGQHIGKIRIHEDHSTIDLPEGMPDEVLQELKRVRVVGQPLEMSRLGRAVNTKRGGGRPPKRKTASAGVHARKS